VEDPISSTRGAIELNDGNLQVGDDLGQGCDHDRLVQSCEKDGCAGGQ
jgi:hypothetical protein